MAVMNQQRLRAFSARRFIGKNVYDVTGDRVGEIDDLIIDMQSSCARFAIVGVGGVLGMGERHYIVPTQAMSMNTETGALMLNVDRARLGNAPMFDRNNPPDFSDEQWTSSIYSYYGLQYQPSGMQGGMGGMGGGMQGGMGGEGGGMQQGGMGGGMQGGMGGQQGGTQGGMGGQQGSTQQPIGQQQSGMGGQSGTMRREGEDYGPGGSGI